MPTLGHMAVSLSLALAACSQDYVPLRKPLPTECTIGLAMGTATVDGRPICWKNRDWSDDGNNRLIYDNSGTYAFIGIGSAYSMMGLNETGLSVGNSMVSNLDDGGDNFAITVWALENASTVEEVRQAIIAETSGGESYWYGRGASGCFPFMDSQGFASMFEVGVYSYYEYDPTNPNRLAQFPMQIVARANDAHKNTDHTDDSSTGGDRYTTARDMLVDRAESNGIIIEEMLQAARRGEPGGVHLISNSSTVAAQVNHGVTAGDDPRIATMWASVGQPDYSIFVPVWVAAGDSLSIRLTSRSDTEGLAGRSWSIYNGKDSNDYDDYVNALYAPFQANLFEVGDLSRQHWLEHGFDVQQADAISDEAAETAWHIMNSMALGSGRNLNQPPELTGLEIQPAGGGNTFSFSRTASDPDGSLAGTDWDFGDGTGDTGDVVTHQYLQGGIFLVRCRVEDDEGSRNSRWVYHEVSVGPACGNGTVDQGETCDPGAPASHHCCDPAVCQWIAYGETDPQSVCSGAPACQRDGCDGAGSCIRVNLGAGTPCASDNLFCNGQEACDGAGSCASSGDPCTGQSICDEPQDACVGCESDEDCPYCQWCNAGVCQDGSPLDCDDGLFCNGPESCDPAQGCRAGDDPCDDQDPCTFDSCIEDSDSCLHNPNPACGDGGSDGSDTDGLDKMAGGCNCGIGQATAQGPLDLVLLLAGLILAMRKRRTC